MHNSIKKNLYIGCNFDTSVATINNFALAMPSPAYKSVFHKLNLLLLFQNGNSKLHEVSIHLLSVFYLAEKRRQKGHGFGKRLEDL